jgi:CspA family cold shock protein
MRKPLGQLFLSLVLSVIGAFVLMFLLPSFGMEPKAGSEMEAGVLIAIVIVVVLYAQGALQSVIANRRFVESIPTGPREEGTVKWFNSTKGFGFITREDGEDVFVHYRSIRGRNRYLLREGATVSYVLGRSGKGPQAEDVDLAD